MENNNMTESEYDVVVAGHICVDILPDLSQVKLNSPSDFFRPGALVQTGAATTSTGGPVSNTGLNLVKMGIRTALMGKIGTDAFGEIVPGMIRAYGGVADGMIVDPEVSTSYTVVLTPAGYDRMFLHNPGANNTFGADDIDYDLVKKAKLFHLGYPPLMKRMYENDGEELATIFRRVHEMGVTTSLDMAIPDPESDAGRANWKAILEKTLPYVDIFLPSAEETLYMLDAPRFMEWRAKTDGDLLPLFTGDDMHWMSDLLLSYGAKIVGIKSGHRGYYIRTASEKVLRSITSAPPADPAAFADRELWHPTYHIEGHPNATGSGDSSIAGFLASYLRGLSLEECMIRATATGACNVTRPDALSGVKSWDDLTGVLNAGWAVDPLEVTGERWIRNEPAEHFWSRQ